MRFSAVFVVRPVATILIWTGVVLAGLLARHQLPIAPLPRIEFPIIYVQAALPGASPEVMASSVAMPLERALGTISGVSEMTSISTEGSTRITMQFDLDRDVYQASNDVQAAINAALASLPSGMNAAPTYRRVNPSGAPIMTLALTSDTATAGALYDLASNVLQQRLAQVPGVGEVQIAGSSLPAVRVDLQPDALLHYGVSLDQVRQAIVAANSTKPRGVVENSDQQWQIISDSKLDRAADYQPIVIRQNNGAVLRLQDVAKVSDSVENLDNVGYFNDKRAILLLIRPQTNANIIATVDQIRGDLPALQAMLPAGVDMDVAQDRTPGIRASVEEAQLTLVIAVALVIGVVLLFLRNFRAALIPAAAIPVSLIGTFGVIYLLGFSINTMSLMALIIATGFVVDDAIVVLENIMRYIERGLSPFRATLRGAREVSFTVLSMSLSLIAVFIPILFIGGLPGRLFGEFAVTLTVSILISLVVSLTLTPMMAALLLKRRKKPAGLDVERVNSETHHDSLNSLVEVNAPQSTGTKGIAAMKYDAETLVSSGKLMQRMHDGYGRSLNWALNHGRIMLITLVAAVGFNFYLYSVVPKGFFPSQDIGLLLGFFSVDDGVSFKSMQPKLDHFRQVLMRDPAVKSVTAYARGSGGSNSSFLAVQLAPRAERKASAQEVINRLRPQLSTTPGARLTLVAAQDVRAGGRSSAAQYQYTLLASDFNDLREWRVKVQRAMSALPELTDVQTDVEDSGNQATITIDRDQAARLGVSMQAIASALNNSFAQRQVSVIYGNLNQYRVVLNVDPRFSQGVQSLDRVMIISSSGQQVPLTTFAKIEMRNAPISVSHQGLSVADTISFNLAPNVALGDAVVAIDQAVAEINLPSDRIQASFQGTAQLLQSTLMRLPWLILAALVTMYIVLGILYESAIHPLTILSTLPSAGVGALLALLLLKTEFTLIAFIGLFLLIGIVKKNAIMMVDFALDAQRRHGMTPRQAIHAASLTRLRPILMTTLAAIAGAIPLVLAHGAGAEIRQPLGITIVGGLVLSQLLTLYTTPVVYLYLDRLRTIKRQQSLPTP
jgi:multidrug efflux pump